MCSRIVAMCRLTHWNIRTTRMPSTSQVLALSILVALIGYSSVTEVSGSNVRHRSHDRSDSLKPTFRPSSTNITVNPGDRAVLNCRVQNLGMKTVSWRKEGEMNPLTIGLFTFSPDTRITLDHNLREREWTLIIQAVRPEDEGWYHCQITSKEDQNLFFAIKLNVRTVQITGTPFVVEGSQMRLMCNATGKPNPPHNLEWFKDGELLRSDAAQNLIITKKIETKVLVSVLVIGRVELTDKGTYVCRSSNEDQAKFKLTVLNPAINSKDMEKRDKGLAREQGQQNSPYRDSGYHRGSSQWLHRKSACTLPVVCSVILLVLDTRWRS